MAKVSKRNETPIDALNTCLDIMEVSSSIPFAKGVRKTVYEKALPNFEQFHDDWPKWVDRVKHMSKWIGVFAEFYAFAAYSSEVKEEHAIKAIRVVGADCDAGRKAVRYRWCQNI